MAENDLKVEVEAKVGKVKNKFDPEEFRVKFRAFFAVLGFLAAVAFLFTSVLNTEAQASKYTGTIIGFMTGTLVTLVFTFYFGSSDKPEYPPPEIKNNIQI